MKEERGKKVKQIKKIAIFILFVMILQVTSPVIGDLALITINYANNNESVVYYQDGDLTYSLTHYSGDVPKATVEITNKNAKQIKIKSTIPYEGKNYGVVRIAGNFYDCPNLEYLEMPCNIVNSGAFGNSGTLDYGAKCEKLEWIKFNKGSAASYSNVIKNDTDKLNLSRSGLDKCPKLRRIDLEAGITAVADNGCENLKNLEHVVVSTDFCKIGNYAFKNCEKLERIVCYQLNLNTYSYLKEIGSLAFDGCNSLKLYDADSDNILYKLQLNVLASNAFNNSGLPKLDLSNCNLQVLKSGTFMNCKKLVSVKLPNNLLKIENCAFYGAGFMLQNTATKVITKIEVPDGVEEIESMAFQYANNMEVKLPHSVRKIADDAFVGFNGVIKCPAKSVAADYLKNKGISYETYSDSDRYTIDGVTYELSGTVSGGLKATLVKYSSSVGAVKIPRSISRRGTRYIVKEIGAHSFENSNVSSVTLQDTITDISTKAFANCKNLNNILIPNNVVRITNDAFDGSTKVNIVCKADSFAYKYALKNNIKYSLGENMPTKTTSTGSKGSQISTVTNTTSTTNYVTVDKESPMVQFNSFTPQSGWSNNCKVNWKVSDAGVGINNVKITYQDGTVEFNRNLNGEKSVTYVTTVNKNGRYYIYADDKNGNKLTNCYFDIGTIDNDYPQINQLYFDAKQGKATINWSASDSSSGIKYWKLSTKAEDWNDNYNSYNACYLNVSGSINVSTTGTYYLYVKDLVGNARCSSITINKIDNKKPVFSTQPKVSISSGKATITFSAEDKDANDYGITNYKLSTRSDGLDGEEIQCTYKGKISNLAKTGTVNIPVSKDGTYYVVLQDAVGHKTISNPVTVDTVKPYIVSIVQTSNKTQNTGKTINDVHYLSKESKITLRVTFNEKIKNIDLSKIKINGNTYSDVKTNKLSDNSYELIISGNGANISGLLSIGAGFLEDYSGNKSVGIKAIKDSITKKEIKIVVDKLAPKIDSTYKDNRIVTTITDDTGIAKYQWKVLDDDDSVLWTGDLHKNLNKKEINHKWTLVNYKNKKVSLFVEDILGNTRTDIIYPYVTAKVSFVSRSGNIVKYRITTNVKTKLYNDYLKNINSSTEKKNCEIKELKAEDDSGKKYLLTIDTKGSKESENLVFQQGIIFAYNPHSSMEANIEFKLDNVAPIISFGAAETVKKQREIKLSFNLIENDSGIKKYQFSRDGKVVVSKTVNSTGGYTGSVKVVRNGTLKLTVWDKQGNISEKEITFNNLDRTAPKVTNVSYGKPDENGDVNVIITTNEKVEIDGWYSISKDVKQKTYKESDLTGTGIKDVVEVVDEAGNKTTVNLEDKIAPRIVGDIKKTASSSTSTEVEITFNEQIMLTDEQVASGWKLSKNKKVITKTMTANEELLVTDLAGNEIENIISIEIINSASNKLYKGRKNDPSDTTKPTTKFTKYIYLNRPIQSVDLQTLKGHVNCELIDNNKTIKLTYFKRINSNHKIRMIENEEYAESLTILSAKNFVIKGDSNNDGKITDEDLNILKNVAIGKQTETDEYKIFAMDINDDGEINLEDISELTKLLSNN